MKWLILPEKVGADVQEVARGIGLDNRIGSKFLHAGPGFGGSCFPKDTRALVKIAQDYDVQLRIVEAVLGVNDNRKRAMARKVLNAAGGSLRGKTVAVLGLTFKPDTDDMREALSIPLVNGLLDMGAKVRAHDPVGMKQARKELPEIDYCEDPYECALGADILVLVTEWAQFRALDLDRIRPSPYTANSIRQCLLSLSSVTGQKASRGHSDKGNLSQRCLLQTPNSGSSQYRASLRKVAFSAGIRCFCGDIRCFCGEERR
jgi:nucleotide sugar dehydrogenase